MTPRAGQETELRADAVRNRARILRIAREQLAAGETSLQLNAIARLAGVGVGTVYRHFPNRHALVEALSAERFRDLIAEAQVAVAADDPRAGLHRLLRFALDRMLDDPDFAAVLESAADANAQTSDLRAELDQAVAGLLDRARLSGAIRDGVDAEVGCAGRLRNAHGGWAIGGAQRLRTVLVKRGRPDHVPDQGS
ncbi:TetR family transcriptional regulator [Streptomyces griseoincarnatus]